MTRNEKGFSAVEALVVLVMISLIGFAGWFVWQSRDKAEDSSSNDSANTSPQEGDDQTEPTDETANWREVTSGQGAFELRVPDGWKMQNWNSRDYLYAADYADVTHTAGEVAMVAAGDTNSIDGGIPRRFSVTGNPIAQKDTIGHYFGETPQDFGSVSGVTGKKYVYVYPGDVDGVKKGDKVYLYRFEGDKTLVTAEYYVLHGDKDQSALVEKALKTLSFE